MTYDLKAELAEARAETRVAVGAFEHLLAMIKGECPSLIEDDMVTFKCETEIEEINEARKRRLGWQ